MTNVERMLRDAHARIDAAIELDDDARAAALQELIEQLESSDLATSNSHVAFTIGKAWYEMPSTVTTRVKNAESWLVCASSLDAQNFLPQMYLAHLWYDEQAWSRALSHLDAIPEMAFRETDPLWDWRDIKVAEMGLACSLGIRDSNRAALWHARFKRLLQSSEEEARLPPVFALEALKSIMPGESSGESLAVARNVLHTLMSYGWGAWMDKELSGTLNALLSKTN